MNIVINRTKEDSQLINGMVKSLKQKVPQRKIFLCLIVGLILFFYDGKGVNSDSFSGSAMVAAFFWGGAAMLFLETFYPKLNFKPIETIENYNKEYKLKISIDDNGISYDSSGVYILMNWSIFKAFRINKRYIYILSSEVDNIPKTVIKRNELTQMQFDELYGFMTGKLIEKK